MRGGGGVKDGVCCGGGVVPGGIGVWVRGGGKGWDGGLGGRCKFRLRTDSNNHDENINNMSFGLWSGSKPPETSLLCAQGFADTTTEPCALSLGDPPAP